MRKPRLVNSTFTSLRAFTGLLFFTCAIQATYCFGDKVYLTSFATKIFVYDKEEETSTSIDLGGNQLSSAISPDGNYVYVCRGNTLKIISTADNTLVRTITDDSFNQLYSVAFSPDGNYAYVANNLATSVVKLDLTGLELTNDLLIGETTAAPIAATITVGTHPQFVVVSPDGSRVYVNNASSNTVSVIETTTNQVASTITVGTFPASLALSSTGDKLYVANFLSDTVSVINTSNNTVAETITVGDGPKGLALTSDNQYLYVVNSSDRSIYRITTSDNSVNSTLITLPANSVPDRIAIASNILYVTDANPKFHMIDLDNSYSVSTVNLTHNPNNLTVLASPVTILPPASISGYQAQMQFLTETDVINIISWTAPESGNAPVKYLVYRDDTSNLIAEVSADSLLTFEDHNRPKQASYTYYVTSVDEDDNESSSFSVTITSE